MAGVRDGQLKQFTGWPQGVNNKSPETAPPTDDFGAVQTLREAVNVDITLEGKPRRRRGYVRRLSGRAHTYADHRALFVVLDGALRAYPDPANLSDTVEVRAGLSDTSIGWASVTELDYTWWTDGQDVRLIAPDLADVAVWAPTPTFFEATATPNVGGLHEGRYHVAVTYVDLYGRESAAGHVVEVDVPSGGGITVTAIPDAPGVVKARVYTSTADGETLYHALDVALPAAGSYLVGAGSGKPLETLWLEHMPAGHLLEAFAGRLLVARENLLIWSEALRYGLTHLSKNYVRFGGRISMVKAVAHGDQGAGVYIADDKRTYFQTGSNPKEWQRAIRYPHGAVEGTAISVPASLFGSEYTGTAVYWLATNGVFCLGLPSGLVVPMTQQALALPSFERGASMLRETNGTRAVVTTMTGGSANGLAASDSMVATLRRHGVSTD